jgi:ribonuclease R
MAQLSDILEEKRSKAGSLNFETIEPKVVLDKDFNPIKIIVREKTPATKLIEEAMVLTNEVVASFVFNKEIPLIYRIHEKPDDDAFAEVRQLLGQLGYPSKKLGKATAETFQNVIKFAHYRPDKLIINSVLLRLMKKARYSSLSAGHFGLAVNHYAHFTSPIRRYPDLLVHRQVKALLNNHKTLSEEVMTEAAKQATLREIESNSAERESSTVYVCKLMKNRIGEVFDGIISGVTNFGLFVQLPNSAEGLVHISNIKGDYYRFEPERFILRGLRSGQTYRLGQKVRVKLVQVVVGERQIDLMLV